MHPLLEHLSVFTWMDIIGSKERCIAFLQDIELIPKMRDYCAPECPKCSGPMTVSSKRSYILGWRWICEKFHKKENPCPGYANPLDGTFFEGLKLPLVDVFALMFGYILKINYDGMKDHLDCWRSRREGRVISNVTIINFYSRFDEIILYALNKKGETFNKQGKIDRNKLLKKYIKTLNAESFFRNIVFQLLMDIKSKYPCSKRKVIQTKVDLSSSTGATNVSVSAKSVTSNETVLNASNSTVVNTSNLTLSNTSNATIVCASNSNNLSASISNTVNASNSTVLNTSNSTISNTSDSTILSASNSNILSASNLNNLSACNPVILNVSASTVSNLSTITVSNSLTSHISPVLDSSMNIENTRVGSDINPKSVCVSNNIQSSNIDVSKSSNLTNCLSTSVSEETAFIENTNSTKIENVMNLNNVSPSTDISLDAATKSFSGFVSNSPPSNVIIDSIFHDHDVMDVGMDIDHDEIITTTYND